MLGLDLAQFLFGAQIDRAQPLALAAQPFELLLDLGEIGQRLALLDARPSSATADGSISSMSWISRPMSASRRLAPSKRSSARARSSRAAEAASSAARASRSASASAFSAAASRSAHCAARAFGFGDLADHGLAFFRENLRRVFKFGAVALGLGDALVERGDLVACAVAPLDPAGLVGGERREPLVGEFRLAHDRLLLGAHFGELGALSGDVVAHGGELAFEIGGGCERLERALGFGLGGARLVAAGGQARARLGQAPRAAPPGG